MAKNRPDPGLPPMNSRIANDETPRANRGHAGDQLSGKFTPGESELFVA